MSGSRRSVFLGIDDAGSSVAVDRAVEACAAAGVLDGVSIVGSAHDPAGVCAVASAHGISVSAHLNILEPPLLVMEPVSAASLILGGRFLAARIEGEWRAQIERLLSLGAMLTGLDSHRHVHHLPRLGEVAIRLAQEYGIGRIRTAVLPDPLSRPSGPVLDLLGGRLARRAAAAGLRTFDLMAGFGASGRLTRRYLEGLDLPECEIELVSHPATEPLWSPGQPLELALLTSDWFREWKSGRERPGS